MSKFEGKIALKWCKVSNFIHHTMKYIYPLLCASLWVHVRAIINKLTWLDILGGVVAHPSSYKRPLSLPEIRRRLWNPANSHYGMPSPCTSYLLAKAARSNFIFALCHLISIRPDSGRITRQTDSHVANISKWGWGRKRARSIRHPELCEKPPHHKDLIQWHNLVTPKELKKKIAGTILFFS